MKYISTILILVLLCSCNNTQEVAIPSFQLDVQFSNEIKENITIEIVTSTIPKNQITNFTNSDRITLATKKILLNKPTILTIDDLMIDSKYKKNIDNLEVLIYAYPTHQKNDFYIEDTIEKNIKELKNKKTIYKVHIIRT